MSRDALFIQYQELKKDLQGLSPKTLLYKKIETQMIAVLEKTNGVTGTLKKSHGDSNINRPFSKSDIKKIIKSQKIPEPKKENKYIKKKGGTKKERWAKRKAQFIEQQKSKIKKKLTLKDIYVSL